jgi:hypothetical protein
MGEFVLGVAHDGANDLFAGGEAKLNCALKKGANGRGVTANVVEEGKLALFGFFSADSGLQNAGACADFLIGGEFGDVSG